MTKNIDYTKNEIKKVWKFICEQPTALLVISFVDIIDSTTNALIHGDFVADEIRQQFEKIIEENTLDTNRSLLVKFLGDGAMLVYIDPSYAIENSIRIQDSVNLISSSSSIKNELPPFSLRIGLNLGQITIEKGIKPDFFGFHVNKAARIEGHCKPGLVAMGYSVFDSAYPRLQQHSHLFWKYIGKKTLKGFSNQEPIYLASSHKIDEVDKGELIINPKELIGYCVSNYKLDSFLGFCGYGCVYKAKHTTLKKKVALKISHWSVEDKPEILEDFERGVRAQIHLKHPNIVELYDYGEFLVGSDTRLVSVMELIDGKTIGDWVGAINSKEKLNQLIALFLPICDAINFAHNKTYFDKAGFQITGIFHGDIKPKNIIITKQGQPKIINFMMINYQRLLDTNDFQQVKLIENVDMTQLFGIPAFMSPEQAEMGYVTPRSDIFSLAKTFLSLVVGRCTATIEGAALDEIIYSSIVLNKKQKEVLQKALNPLEELRHGSINDFKDALESSLHFPHTVAGFFKK